MYTHMYVRIMYVCMYMYVCINKITFNFTTCMLESLVGFTLENSLQNTFGERNFGLLIIYNNMDVKNWQNYYIWSYAKFTNVFPHQNLLPYTMYVQYVKRVFKWLILSHMHTFLIRTCTYGPSHVHISVWVTHMCMGIPMWLWDRYIYVYAWTGLAKL